MATTAFITMRNPTPFPTMQMAVVERRALRQSGIPPTLHFPQPSLHARVIPSKVGALQVVRQVHRIAREEPSQPMRIQLCMQYGQKTNTPFPTMLTAVVEHPQVKPKPTDLILRFPLQRLREADIPLRDGELQAPRQLHLISREGSTLPIPLQPCKPFGRVMLLQPTL